MRDAESAVPPQPPQLMDVVLDGESVGSVSVLNFNITAPTRIRLYVGPDPEGRPNVQIELHPLTKE